MADYKPVLHKEDFVKRYSAGEFGNASPTWDNPQEFRRGEYRGLTHIRNRVKGGKTWYDVHSDILEECWDVATKHYKPEQLYISAMAPTHETILQGEVKQAPWGIYLHCTNIRKPMRDALAERSMDLGGLKAITLLNSTLCTNSLDWLYTLLARYPDHVVEFSTYRVEWGTLPGFNTVFWEVRRY